MFKIFREMYVTLILMTLVSSVILGLVTILVYSVPPLVGALIILAIFYALIAGVYSYVHCVGDNETRE